MPKDERLVAVLGSVIAVVITMLKEHGIGPDLPVTRYDLMWMVATDENHASSREETRTEPYLMEIFWNFRTELDSLPEIQTLHSITDHYAVGNLVGLGRPGTAESLLKEYFRRVGSLSIDPQQISQVCDCCQSAKVGRIGTREN